MIEHIKNNLIQSQNALNALIQNNEALQSIQLSAEMMIASIKQGGKIISCGNGGSMCDAMHFAEELSGRFRMDRPALPAIAISDPSHLSCVANDYGYKYVFSRYLEAIAKPNDVLLAISTSGNSENILIAAEKAKELGVKVVLLTGKQHSKIADFADSIICTPGGTNFADRVQELHIKCIHIMIELIENGMAK